MTKTVTQLNETLEKERKLVKQGKLDEGMFGIKECRKSIESHMEIFHKTLHELYCEFVVRGLTEPLFNTLMIIACEQMLEEEKQKEN